MNKRAYIFIQMMLCFVFIAHAMEQQPDPSKKITVTVRLVDGGDKVIFNKNNGIIEMPKQMLLLSPTLNNMLTDLGEESFKDEETGGWPIPEAVTEESIDTLILLWNTLPSLDDKKIPHTIEGYSKDFTDQTKTQELWGQLKKPNFEQLYDLIKLADFFGFIFITNAACEKFADKIRKTSDIEHVLSMGIALGPDKVIAHHILAKADVRVYPFNGILGDLCVHSIGKGRRRVLEKRNATKGDINRQGDVLFFSAPNMYVYSVKKNIVTKVPIEDQFEADSERFALSPSGNYIVCVSKSDRNKITNMYLIDMKTGHKRVIPRPELYQDEIDMRKFYKGNVANIIFSPDEKNILALYDNAIYQYDIITGDLTQPLPMKLTEEGKVMVNISFGEFDPAYLFVRYFIATSEGHEGVSFFNALYDYEKKSWVSEDHISRRIDGIPSSSKNNFFFVDNESEKFGLDNIYSAKKIKEKRDIFMLRGVVSFVNLAEDKINYRCLGSLVCRTVEGTSDTYESMVILADIVPDEVRILIKDYNKPIGTQQVTLNEALYLYAAKLNDWDPSEKEGIDTLFAKANITLEPGIIDVRRLATIKNWPIPELEYIPEVIVEVRQLLKENVSNVVSQSPLQVELPNQNIPVTVPQVQQVFQFGGNVPMIVPQPFSQPSLWQRYAPTILQRGVQAAGQQLSAVQQKFRSLYNNYSTQINYALGAATVSGLGWLYLKYGKDSGLSLSK